MKSPAGPQERIIVALDYARGADALRIVEQLSSFTGFFKVGLQLYTAEGPEFVRQLRALGLNVFLDLKLHDIPNTVARAVEAAVTLDVQMLTLHLSGGQEMISAAVRAKSGGLQLLGVTVLTSATEETLRETGIEGAPKAQVLRLTALGAAAGIDGVVASPHELAALRQGPASTLKLVIPGIRPVGTAPDDQKRFMTPKEALAGGADYLVIGRPITAAADPEAALQSILGEL